MLGLADGNVRLWSGQPSPSRRHDDGGSGSVFTGLGSPEAALESKVMMRRSLNLKTRCILHVEDDQKDALIVRQVLQRAGLACQLQVVRDGPMAIEYLSGGGAYADRQKYPLPYLVLLDLGLPQRGGLEVLQWIRQHPSLKKPVVLVLSSSALAEDVDRACELGANSYMMKPSGLPKTREMAQLVEGWWLRYHHLASKVESADGSSPAG